MAIVVPPVHSSLPYCSFHRRQRGPALRPPARHLSCHLPAVSASSLAAGTCPHPRSPRRRPHRYMQTWSARFRTTNEHESSNPSLANLHVAHPRTRVFQPTSTTSQPPGSYLALHQGIARLEIPVPVTWSTSSIGTTSFCKQTRRNFLVPPPFSPQHHKATSRYCSAS